MILVACFVISGLGNITSYAATNKKEMSAEEKTYALIEYVLNINNLENWLETNEDYSYTECAIVFYGKADEPVMLLRNGGVSHAAGYSRVLMVVDNEVKQIFEADWIDSFDTSSGLIELCQLGGGYGETDSFYYVLSEGAPKETLAEGDISKDFAETHLPGKNVYQEYIDGESVENTFDEDAYNMLVEKMEDYYGSMYLVKGKPVSDKEFEKFLKKNTSDDTYMDYDALEAEYFKINDLAFAYAENEDANAELFINFLDGNEPFYYKNDETDPQYISDITEDFGNSVRVAFRDVNGDGKNELLVNICGAWTYALYENKGKLYSIGIGGSLSMTSTNFTANNEVVSYDENHAGRYTYEVQKINRNNTVKEVCSFAYWYPDESSGCTEDSYYYLDDKLEESKEITKEEYEELCGKYVEKIVPTLWVDCNLDYGCEEELMKFATDINNFEDWEVFYRCFEETMGTILYVDRGSTPLLILKNDWMSGASETVRVYRYRDGKIEYICGGDWIESIDVDSGLIQTSVIHNSFGEITSYYCYAYDEKIVAQSDILSPNCEIFNSDGEFNKERYEQSRKDFPKNIYQILNEKGDKLEEAKETDFNEYINKYSGSYSKITRKKLEQSMVPVSEWSEEEE